MLSASLKLLSVPHVILKVLDGAVYVIIINSTRYTHYISVTPIMILYTMTVCIKLKKGLSMRVACDHEFH